MNFKLEKAGVLIEATGGQANIIVIKKQAHCSTIIVEQNKKISAPTVGPAKRDVPESAIAAHPPLQYPGQQHIRSWAELSIALKIEKQK